MFTCVLKRSTPLQTRAPKNPAGLLRSWVQDSMFQLRLTNCSVRCGRRAPFLRCDTFEHISLALPARIIILLSLPKPLSRKYEICFLTVHSVVPRPRRNLVQKVSYHLPCLPYVTRRTLPKPGAETFTSFPLPDLPSAVDPTERKIRNVIKWTHNVWH